jgi:hypothetical protein
MRHLSRTFGKDVTMNTNELELIDLGAVSTETRGLASIGPVDQQQGAKYALGGIEVDD